MRASVILPVFRPQSGAVPRLLERLRAQTAPPLEILLVESVEGGLAPAFAETRGVRHLAVPLREFDHGGTRNSAAAEASGDAAVFLTQDAEPEDERLLENLLRPLSDPAVPLAFGRHIPRPDASPVEAFSRRFNYPESQAGLRRAGIKTVFNSSVCSAVRLDAFREVGGFPEPVPLSEDLILGARLVSRGYRIAYVPEARVLHSHETDLLRQFRKYFDIGAVFARFAEDLPSPNGEGLRYVAEQFGYLLRSGQAAWLPYAAAEAGLKWAGFQLGRLSPSLPDSVNGFLSSNKGYWRRAEEGLSSGVPESGSA